MNTGLTAEQKGARRLGIGGSDAGKIMSGEWGALWRIKTGRAAEEDLSDVLPVQMGTCTEPLNLLWFERRTGRKVTHRGSHMIHPAIPYLRANLDGLTTTARGEPAYLDAKHVGKLDEATILRYTPQGHHCALVAAAVLDQPIDWWCLSVFIGNSKWELVEQPLDPFYAEEYLAKAHEFWGYVTRDEEPPEAIVAVAAPKPMPKLRIVQLEDEFRDAWPNWGAEFADQVRVFNTTKPAADLHAITRDKMKALLPEDVGEVRRGHFKCARDKAGSIRLSLSKGKEETP